MLYYQWIIAALSVIIVYMLMGYGWLWWRARKQESSNR